MNDAQRGALAAEEERRALLAFVSKPAGAVVEAQAVARLIWPTHEMKAQAAGMAAARVLRRLQRRGLVKIGSPDGFRRFWMLA